MNDFNDDFDSFDDSDFEDFNNSSSSKGEISPILKIFMIIAVVILIVAGAMIFVGKDEEKESTVSDAIDQKEVLGGEISQNYAGVLQEVNEQRLEEAVQTGSSTIPMLINPEEQELLTNTEELPPYQEFDPLQTFRSIVDPTAEEKAPFEEPAGDPQLDTTLPEVPMNTVIPQQVVPSPSPEAVQALAQAMATDVSDILSIHNPKAGQITQVTPKNYFEQVSDSAEGESGQLVDTDGDGIPDTPLGNIDNLSGASAEQGSTQEELTETILIPAGTINYAQMLIEANSDIPGPILAQLVSGPLSGAKLIGNFTTKGDYLVLSFNTIVVDGQNQSIRSVAINPDTTLSGLATEVDQRYWSRVFLPAAAKFLEGVGEAIAQDTETTVTVSGDTVIQETSALDFEQELGKGVEEGFGEIASFMEEEAGKVRPLIRVSRGTPVGIFFIEPVLE